jgi:sulfur carrier protein
MSTASPQSKPEAAHSDLAIELNGEPRRTAATTLAELLTEAGYGDARVATARNGAFVPAADRAGERLAAGDRIEVVAPRQGG